MRKLHFLFTVGLLPFFLSGNSQPVYQIPGALIQPQFVFPIFFEDATGARDTLYLGYDSLSSGTGVYGLGNDDVWGVKMVHVDTGSFHAFWEQQNGDSVYKVNVSPFFNNGVHPGFPYARIFQFRNAILPLRIYWDKNCFYGNNNPFPVSTQPNAEGRMLFPTNTIRENGNILSCIHDEVLITDSFLSGTCHAEDSITIFDPNGNTFPVSMGIDFYLKPWTGIFSSITGTETLDWKVHPNPFSDNIEIYTENQIGRSSNIEISDITGKVLYTGELTAHRTRLDVHAFRPGVYLLRILTPDQGRIFRIIKTGS